MSLGFRKFSKYRYVFVGEVREISHVEPQVFSVFAFRPCVESVWVGKRLESITSETTCFIDEGFRVVDEVFWRRASDSRFRV